MKHYSTRMTLQSAFLQNLHHHCVPGARQNHAVAIALRYAVFLIFNFVLVRTLQPKFGQPITRLSYVTSNKRRELLKMLPVAPTSRYSGRVCIGREFRRLKRAILGSFSFVRAYVSSAERQQRTTGMSQASKRCAPKFVRTASRNHQQSSARKLPACWHLGRIVNYRTERKFGIHSQLHFAARMRARGRDNRAKVILVLSLE